jgi:hypothetical protein
MAAQQFETQLESGERGRIFITVPFVPSAVWGKQARYYVKGTLNGFPFRGSLGTRGGTFFMPVNKELQQGAKIKPGDRVQVMMELDTPEADALPEDFSMALSADPQSKQFFDGLTPFQQNTYVKWIAGAKKAETRELRIQEAIQLLKAGQKQK